MQSAAVVLALWIAWHEFVLNDEDQKEQEYEAITDLVSKLVHPAYVSDAFYHLYEDKELLKKERDEFESDIGALHSFLVGR